MDLAYCYVCHRATDHFAEHDALVEAGLAVQDSFSGSVYRTELWDDDLAREIAEAEFQWYLAEIEGYLAEIG